MLAEQLMPGFSASPWLGLFSNCSKDNAKPRHVMSAWDQAHKHACSYYLPAFKRTNALPDGVVICLQSMVTPSDASRWAALRRALEGQAAPPSFPIDDRVLAQAKQRVALAAKVRGCYVCCDVSYQPITCKALAARLDCPTNVRVLAQAKQRVALAAKVLMFPSLHISLLLSIHGSFT
jgi:hypothetical protein